MSAVVTIREPDGHLTEQVCINALGAKVWAMGEVDRRGGLRGRSCKVETSTGATYCLAPTSRNTGSRYTWTRES
jgi:hypothetical protein